MKKLSLFTLLAIVLTVAIGFSSCKKVKDADLQTTITTALAANPDASDVSVTVEKGVAVLSGTVKDEATSLAVTAIAKAVKNVKSVTSNLTIVPPAPIVPLVNPVDEALISALKDALKDNSSVMSSVKDGIITLTGEIKKQDLPKLMQKVSALKPIKIDNQLTIK